MKYFLSIDKPVSKDAEPIAMILPKGVHPKDLKLDEKKYVYLNKTDKLDPDIHPTQIKMTGDSILFPIYRDSNGFPLKMFIASGTGAGKSYLASAIAHDYMQRHKKNKVCYFSYLDGDKNYDGIKNFHKMRIDEEILDDPIHLDELHDSLCIFDDIAHFSDKEIKKEIYRLRDSSLSAGRHHNSSTIVCQQTMLDGPTTKVALTNASTVVGFPNASSRYQFINWMKRYLALNTKDIDRIINLPSRWILVNQSMPLYILHEKGLELIVKN